METKSCLEEEKIGKYTNILVCCFKADSLSVFCLACVSRCVSIMCVDVCVLLLVSVLVCVLGSSRCLLPGVYKAPCQ